jgi:polyisoprenoid-binding protein YceI
MRFAARIVRHGATARRAALMVALVLIAAAPAAADVRRYVIQRETSEVSFKATSRLMNADGRFHHVRGEVLVEPTDITTARVAVTLEAASIDTGIGLRDSHLRSADFFDVERFPDIIFESIRVEGSARRATVTGRLTMRGVSQEVAVPVDVTLSETALVATGEIVVNRRDFGMSYHSIVNPIGNEVRVSFTIRARAS